MAMICVVSVLLSPVLFGQPWSLGASRPTFVLTSRPRAEKSKHFQSTWVDRECAIRLDYLHGSAELWLRVDYDEESAGEKYRGVEAVGQLGRACVQKEADYEDQRSVLIRKGWWRSWTY
mmetsp:Transcript_89894/g.290396  ORF Transcript_89894/g.290396 Transcript_89894/m.290396 type:complete len:119 (+) Transcript_89894:82-438(+)